MLLMSEEERERRESVELRRVGVLQLFLHFLIQAAEGAVARGINGS